MKQNTKVRIFKNLNFLETKKELTQKLTQLSVEYTKYAKSKSYEKIKEVINREMDPLFHLIQANNSLEFFEEKEKKGEDVPKFRFEAAKDLLIKSLDEVCKILFDCKKVERPLNSAVMLQRFDLPNWQKIRPFEYFLSVLKKNYIAFREVLKTMHKLGKSIFLLYQFQ